MAGRVFGQLGVAGAPVRVIHDTIAAGVYLTIRGGATVAGAVGGEVAAQIGASGGPGGSAAGTPAGRLALSALNAVAGDRLGPGMAPLTIGMAVRAAGRDVDLTTGELAAALPQATPRLAVFVHGLGANEDLWRWRSEGQQRVPYGERLRAEFGYTPLYVRYNTGRHVSVNGRDLAALLDGLTAAWPEQVGELLLVGHSMGGLVIRSACHYGQQASATWAPRVRHVFYIGSPHLGAPLARAAGFAGWAFGKAAETRPFVTMVNGCSAGIKDLRYGYVLDDDWASCDQDSCLRDHRHDTPLLAAANHYVISATVTADPGSNAGAVVGDLLVQPASAHGRRRGIQHIGFRMDSGRRLGGMHHVDLLSHPAVWEAMRGLLQARETN